MINWKYKDTEVENRIIIHLWNDLNKSNPVCTISSPIEDWTGIHYLKSQDDTIPFPSGYPQPSYIRKNCIGCGTHDSDVAIPGYAVISDPKLTIQRRYLPDSTSETQYEISDPTHSQAYSQFICKNCATISSQMISKLKERNASFFLSHMI